MTTILAPLFTSNSGEWQTPPALFAALNSRFQFTLDACATADNAKCKRYFDLNRNGLTQSWQGERVWLNPPYGRGIITWLKKAATEDCFCVCLVPARTDTTWWHVWVMPFASEVILVRGRIRFVGAVAGAPFPSALIVFSKPRAPLRLSSWMPG